MRSNTLRLVLSVLIFANSAFAASKPRQSQQVAFKVLYNFTGGADGCCIYGGLARDFRGNLYGVAYLNDDDSSGGDLFKLTRTSQGYTFHVLKNFSPYDGECMTTPTIDRSGNLFGVCTGSGGGGRGNLWEYSNRGKFTMLHGFSGPEDGMSPEDSVALDKSGNIYGTTYTWGPGGSGTFWKYSRHSRTFTLLHNFADGDDGALLPAGPKIDNTGIVWGTTEDGPNCYYCGNGTVWNYDPSSGTFATVLDLDSTDILEPQSRVVVGEEGNVYGTGFSSGQDNCGVVYELQKDNSYAPIVVYQFTGTNGDGCGPFGRTRFDKPGHLLGTTSDGGADPDCGTVYELKHTKDGWYETILHSFDGSDGCISWGGLVTDHKGNWFGTTSVGGKREWGTVFEISGVP